MGPTYGNLPRDGTTFKEPQKTQINFFDWIREGVKQSVLLGVSDAAEQIGVPFESTIYLDISDAKQLRVRHAEIAGKRLYDLCQVSKRISGAFRKFEQSFGENRVSGVEHNQGPKHATNCGSLTLTPTNNVSITADELTKGILVVRPSLFDGR